MTNAEDHALILEQREPQIRLLRLNRPARLNAFTREMVADFNRHLDTLAEDRECRALILTGAGRGFCSGQDVAAADERNRHAPSGLVERMYWQEQFAGMSERIRALPQVVVAAVNGPCVGAGMAIALAADVRIVARSARFLPGAVRLGLTAGESGISYLLPRLIGASRAFEILLTGRPIEADEAERVGLAARLVDDAELLPVAEQWTRSMLANSPFATQHTKRILWENLDAASFRAAIELENRSQILASMTDDYKEATAAFTEKRAARFTGR
ncbi:enoyl-CoA hydratase [Trinickia violacea]|uniref:Enoyl-CoA hydratase n=1 Tax=Trinickia violacea TaxID=2571746 RepID=A0A4P8IRN3_9BURK|nr:enoyl-CoA hydratase-related protein [Trinickia violacea]QCP50375.1 enoyl-CoA hydratase [Trinickia violacea]